MDTMKSDDVGSACTPPSLAELAQELAGARQVTLKLSTDIENKRHAFAVENAALITAHSEAALKAAGLEADIKRLAVHQYSANPDKGKQLGCGVAIRVSVSTTYAYEATQALSWAKEHGICLQLNVKAFEEVCATDAKPDFVGVACEDVVTATIAKDLVKALTVEVNQEE